MYLKNFAIQASKDLLIRFPKKTWRLFEYLKEFRQFKSRGNQRFEVAFKDIYPCITDKLRTTPFDHHYIYHPAWAARILSKTKPEYHVDFSSILYFGTIVSAFIPVKFYDYRPADIQLSGWQGGFADLCKLDLPDNSFPSVSCMHTVEHIGLGRYGDPLDPAGDIRAIDELIRITAPGGDILFVTPVGRERIEFNAHRIYAYQSVVDLFHNCQLKEFALIPDAGGLLENADPSLVAQQEYGCGCFWFKKN